MGRNTRATQLSSKQQRVPEFRREFRGQREFRVQYTKLPRLAPRLTPRYNARMNKPLKITRIGNSAGVILQDCARAGYAVPVK